MKENRSGSGLEVDMRNLMVTEKFLVDVYKLVLFLEEYDLEPRERALCDILTIELDKKIHAMKRREEYTKNIIARKMAEEETKDAP